MPRPWIMRNAVSPSLCASSRSASTASFTSRGAIVCRSKVSVIGIRTGSSEDIGGGDSDMVLFDFQRGDLTQCSRIVHLKLAPMWIDQPYVPHSPGLILFELLHHLQKPVIGQEDFDRHQWRLGGNHCVRLAPA